MFRLSQKAIDDFKKVYFQHQGVKLTDDEANTKGLEVLEMVKIVFRDIPKNEYEHFKRNLSH